MALAQFVRMPNVRVTKQMFAPAKHISDPMQWYKNARKLIKELPSLCEHGCEQRMVWPEHPSIGPQDHWHLSSNVDISIKWIKFDLVNALGEKAHLVIDRTVPSMG